jgi:hypothetical protein
MHTDCPSCGQNNFNEIFRFSDVPVSGVFRASKSDRLPKHDLILEACASCGLLRNASYASPPDYLEKPRPTARQMPAYLTYLLKLIKDSFAKEDLILEIGSNDGSFLDVLQDAGFTNLCGIEPSSELVKMSSAKGHKVIADYFGPAIVDAVLAKVGAPKLILCRHTLEHVPLPKLFIQGLHALISRNKGAAIVEVPDSTAISEGLNFVEFWDEHLFYFTPHSLRRLMENNGFNVTSTEIFPHLDTRNLFVNVKVNESPIKTAAYINEIDFWQDYFRRFNQLAEKLKNVILAQPRPIYLIGASHPQCNFVNYLGLSSVVDFMIDDDPFKADKLPFIDSQTVSIITTDEFTNNQEKGGSLILTGFGYDGWSKKISEIALSRQMKIIDPRCVD